MSGAFSTIRSFTATARAYSQLRSATSAPALSGPWLAARRRPRPAHRSQHVRGPPLGPAEPTRRHPEDPRGSSAHPRGRMHKVRKRARAKAPRALLGAILGRSAGRPGRWRARRRRVPPQRGWRAPARTRWRRWRRPEWPARVQQRDEQGGRGAGGGEFRGLVAAILRDLYLVYSPCIWCVSECIQQARHFLEYTLKYT